MSVVPMQRAAVAGTGAADSFGAAVDPALRVRSSSRRHAAKE